VSNTGIDPTAPNFRQLRLDDRFAGRELASSSPASVSNGAVQITKDVNAALPTAKIFGRRRGVHRLLHRRRRRAGVPAVARQS